MTRPVIYHCRGSRGLRALWAAEEVGADYDLVILPFPPREKAREFLGINPLGTIPAMVDAQGYVLTESSAIAQYFATWPGHSHLAVGPEEADYAAFVDLLHHADATLTFPQTVYLRFARFERDSGLAKAGEAYADWFRSRLKKTDGRLESRSFLCADRFTVADIAIAYAFILATQIGLGEFLSARQRDFLTRVTSRPAYLRARAREADG